MAAIERGRFTDGHDGEVVVFLIGMRVNRWWALRSWWPAFAAMPRMLRELAADPGSGLLGHRMLLGAGGPLVVQYWSSLESLLAYAHDPRAEHRPAWRAFNEQARRSGGAVGIWHETYRVAPGAHETMYVDLPPGGLAAATSRVPAGQRGHSARERLSRAA